jgi:hypothetical protein
MTPDLIPDVITDRDWLMHELRARGFSLEMCERLSVTASGRVWPRLTAQQVSDRIAMVAA